MGEGANRVLSARSGEERVTDKMRRTEAIVVTGVFDKDMIRYGRESP